MADSTLSAIKKKVRRLVASPSLNQLSEADLEEYINVFYEQDLPSHLKIWNLHDKYTFFTTPYEDQYTFDTDLYHAVLPPVYVNGYQSFYSQSEGEFFRMYPKSATEQKGPSGTASAGPYTFTLSSTPILKRQVTLSVKDTAGVQHVANDVPDVGVGAPNPPTGTWVDSTTGTALTGSINYETGACSITWPNLIDPDQSITIRYSPYQASRPTAVLFFKNTFILRPVPDDSYRVVVEVYKKPTQLLANDASEPEVNQWWQYIAFGAALKILQDRQDVDSIQNIMPWFKEQEALILYRTATQQAPERTATIYTDTYSGGWGYGRGG